MNIHHFFPHEPSRLTVHPVSDCIAVGVLALARFRVYLTRVIKPMGAEAQHYQPQRGGAAGHINRRAQGGNLFSIPPSWWQPGGRLPERLETNPTRKRGEQRRPNAPPTGRMRMTWHRRGQAPQNRVYLGFSELIEPQKRRDASQPSLARF